MIVGKICRLHSLFVDFPLEIFILQWQCTWKIQVCANSENMRRENAINQVGCYVSLSHFLSIFCHDWWLSQIVICRNFHKIFSAVNCNLQHMICYSNYPFMLAQKKTFQQNFPNALNNFLIPLCFIKHPLEINPWKAFYKSLEINKIPHFYVQWLKSGRKQKGNFRHSSERFCRW